MIVEVDKITNRINNIKDTKMCETFENIFNFSTNVLVNIIKFSSINNSNYQRKDPKSSNQDLFQNIVPIFREVT